MIQFRDKDSSISDLYNNALKLKLFLEQYKIPFIINDHVQIAKDLDLDGVHIGQSDMKLEEANKILDQNKIIGLSIENNEQLKNANNSEVSYVTASAIFPTTSKKNCKTYWGVSGLADLVKKSRHPMTAIGGINTNNIFEIAKTNVRGVAVIGALHNSTNPYKTAKQFIKNLS